MSEYLLLDEEDSNMWGDGNVTHCDVTQKRGFTDT